MRGRGIEKAGKAEEKGIKKRSRSERGEGREKKSFVLQLWNYCWYKFQLLSR